MFEILLTLIIVMNVSFFTTLIRLRVKHGDVFAQLQLNGMFFGSVRQLARIIEFMIKRENSELNDTFLSVAGYIFVVSLATTIPLMFIYVLHS